MDGRGGCCIARYAAAGGHAYDISQVDRIMLKFRPIAPKPAASGAAPAASDGGSDGHAKATAGGGRGRRKSCSKDTSGNSGCNGTRRCTNGRKRKSCSPDQTAVIPPDHHQQHFDQKAVTLALLPEAPDLSPTKQSHKMPFWLSFNNAPGVQDNYALSHSKVGPGPDPTVMVPPPQQHPNHHHHQPAVRSCVVVEAVTDTCPTEGVRVCDVRALEKDTCPVIITDRWNRVVGANEAYRRMVMGDTWRDRNMAVSVEMRERVPDRVQGLQAFTCRVRVQRTNEGKESRGSSSLTLPCDVWRIDGGGFAWRLDVDAALSLGLGR